MNIRLWFKKTSALEIFFGGAFIILGVAKQVRMFGMCKLRARDVLMGLGGCLL
jgi:hypothetical protein